MRSLPSAIVAIWALIAPVAALAQGAAPTSDPIAPAAIRGVLELYTSQGCSSCPTADALFETYSQRQDLVALTLPVDYWDYLGWKDTLAQAKFSDRQRAYARARGDGHVYTPQIVVNGRAHVVGSQSAAIEGALANAAKGFRAVQPPIRAEMSGADGDVVVEIGGAAATSDTGVNTVWLAVVEPRVPVVPRKGENSGRKLTYFNVVRDLVPVGKWDGAGRTIRLERQALTMTGEQRCAVLIQHGISGPIVGAAWVVAR